MTSLLLLFACGASDAPPASTPAEAQAAAPAAEAPAPAEPALLVSGTIEAPAELPEAQSVFVSLRVADRPGPPLAAKKLPAGPFPLKFTLTEADRPMVMGPVPDAVEIKVTLDVDGNPMVKSPTDLEVVQATTKGTTDLSLMLAPRPE